MPPDASATVPSREIAPRSLFPLRWCRRTSLYRHILHGGGQPGLRDLHHCWPGRKLACLQFVHWWQTFGPEIVLSQLMTAELARLIRSECRLRWCCVNSTFYFGPGSRRPLEADFADTMTRPIVRQFVDAIHEADIVLHGTDPLFDPPPSSLPSHHHYVGPLPREQGTPHVRRAGSSEPGPERVTATGEPRSRARGPLKRARSRTVTVR